MITRVKTTHLEMTGRKEFHPKDGYDTLIRIEEIQNDTFINLMMFVGVGLPWKWYSRLIWKSENWNQYLQNSKSRLFLAYRSGKLIGYYELEWQKEDTVEIKFFGLLPGNYGSGLGGMLLSHAIDSAWQNGTKRVWVHTCSLDSQSAIKNYIARGFKIFKEEIKDEDVPDKQKLIELISGFFGQYYDEYSSSN